MRRRYGQAARSQDAHAHGVHTVGTSCCLLPAACAAFCLLSALSRPATPGPCAYLHGRAHITHATAKHALSDLAPSQLRALARIVELDMHLCAPPAIVLPTRTHMPAPTSAEAGSHALGRAVR